MDYKNFEDKKTLNNQWDENDILNEDMFNISNMSNMISMSNIPNMYMPNMVSTPNGISRNKPVILE